MKKCPKCKQKLPEYADTCPECLVDIDSGKPVTDPEYLEKYAKEELPEVQGTISEDGDYIEILRTFNQTDIAFIKSILEGEGISYYLKGEHFMNMRPLFRPVVLMVKEDEIEKTKEILKDMNIAFSGLNTKNYREEEGGNLS